MNTPFSTVTSITTSGSNPSVNVVAGADTAIVAIASGAGNYSANAAIGDAVIRSLSKAIHLQSGAGASAMTIASNNTITIRQPLTISTTTTGLNYILECLNPNTTLGNLQAVNIGQSRTDANCMLTGFRYEASNDPNNTSFIGLFGTNKPLLTFQNNGTATFSNCSLIGGISATTYTMSADAPWPNATNTAVINWVASSTVGLALSYSAGTFTNSTGYTCWVSIIWSTRRVSNGFGSNYYQIVGGGGTYGQVNTGALDWMTTSALIRLTAGNSFTLFGQQDSGSGNNFQAAGSSLSVQLFPI